MQVIYVVMTQDLKGVPSIKAFSNSGDASVAYEYQRKNYHDQLKGYCERSISPFRSDVMTFWYKKGSNRTTAAIYMRAVEVKN